MLLLRVRVIIKLIESWLLIGYPRGKFLGLIEFTKHGLINTLQIIWLILSYLLNLGSLSELILLRGNFLGSRWRIILRFLIRLRNLFKALLILRERTG